MTITVKHTTVGRRISVLIFMGVSAALVGLGASGNAAAIPPPPIDPGWGVAPDNPRGPTTVNPVVRDWGLPPPPPMPWGPPPPAGAGFGDSVSLNPQPEPPSERGRRVSLNPQPLPPGPDDGTRVGLNPQPLPPGPDLWLDVLRLPGF
jgi:hypothetical protein